MFSGFGEIFFDLQNHFNQEHFNDLVYPYCSLNLFHLRE